MNCETVIQENSDVGIIRLTVGYFKNLGVTWIRLKFAESYDLPEKAIKDLPTITFGQKGPDYKMNYGQIKFTDD